jgi:hypothetical protein
VASGLAVLGSGLALIPLGHSSGAPLATVAGQRIDPLTIHQICFVLWLVATGAHVLTRTVPALHLARGGPGQRHRVPGRTARAVVVIATLALSVATAVVVVDLPTNWHTDRSALSLRGL